MTTMFQVRTYLEGRSISDRRPIFNTVLAATADDAKRAVRRAIFADQPHVKIKKMTATPIY